MAEDTENKENVGQHPEDCQCLKCSPEPNRKQCHFSKPEQPNTNAMLIKTIQGLTTVILNSIHKLPESTLKDQAYDDMNIFETGVLFDLQKEYE